MKRIIFSISVVAIVLYVLIWAILSYAPCIQYRITNVKDWLMIFMEYLAFVGTVLLASVTVYQNYELHRNQELNKALDGRPHMVISDLRIMPAADKISMYRSSGRWNLFPEIDDSKEYTLFFELENIGFGRTLLIEHRTEPPLDEDYKQPDFFEGCPGKYSYGVPLGGINSGFMPQRRTLTIICVGHHGHRYQQIFNFEVNFIAATAKNLHKAEIRVDANADQIIYDRKGKRLDKLPLTGSLQIT